ncbi:MAG: [FeFe] hydrogenase H-cluster radical SAM maturase HydE [Oscillospiraceae bacterium]|nr:[FeFe] hydrogenase H-cluster radical SAM maturase HydE [Oscillospiraceae bacterium]
MKKLVDKLFREQTLTQDELKAVLSADNDLRTYLHECARKTTVSVFGNAVYVRGLIEFTNYCKNDCLYCGLRCSNADVKRYRMSDAQIMECCALGYANGLRTFVLQGGEDLYFTDDRLCALIQCIKAGYPDCAVTLSLGERDKHSLRRLRESGVDRYLLRQETANAALYASLHPPEMSIDSRKQCLYDLKELGFQVGCGFMVGVPGQTLDNITEDLGFIAALRPAMVGVGPFVPHSGTPLGSHPHGDLALTLNIIAILRLMNPNLLLPATTALATIDKSGREHAVLAGANVVMPNLTPSDVRADYLLYNNKAYENIDDVKARLHRIEREAVTARGDYREL